MRFAECFWNLQFKRIIPTLSALFLFFCWTSTAPGKSNLRFDVYNNTSIGFLGRSVSCLLWLTDCVLCVLESHPIFVRASHLTPSVSLRRVFPFATVAARCVSEWVWVFSSQCPRVFADEITGHLFHCGDRLSFHSVDFRTFWPKHSAEIRMRDGGRTEGSSKQTCSMKYIYIAHSQAAWLVWRISTQYVNTGN